MTGRPRQFDRDEALDRAMELFWQKGYGATSMSDLVEHMGLSKQSLYNTFGDKRALFLEALDRYAERSGHLVAAELHREDIDAQGLRGLFRRIARGMSCSGPRACMMAATSLEVGAADCEVSARVRAYLEGTRVAFEGAIERCAERGELTCSSSPRAIARHLINTLGGLGVMGRSGATPEEVDEVVDVALSVLK